jgi:hypothetical protein
MIFHKLRPNTSYERQWTSAVSIHPRSRSVEWTCPECGTYARYPAGSFDVTIEGGTAYPDFLSCGAYPLLIVSGRVIESWTRHGIGPFTKYPVGVATALETQLLPRDAPEYFRVEIAGEIKVDVSQSGASFTRFCRRCGGFMTDPMLVKAFAFFPGSWDGSPLFRDHRLFPRVTFCTEFVQQVSEAEKLTNVCFKEMLTFVDK